MVPRLEESETVSSATVFELAGVYTYSEFFVCAQRKPLLIVDT